MSTIDEIKRALNTLKKNGTPKKNITILHCHSEYPSDLKDLNLNNILTLKKYLNVKLVFQIIQLEN